MSDAKKNLTNRWDVKKEKYQSSLTYSLTSVDDDAFAIFNLHCLISHLNRVQKKGWLIKEVQGVFMIRTAFNSSQWTFQPTTVLS